MGIFLAVIITAVIGIISVAVGYFIWLKTRPKKETWHARIYVMSEGVKRNILKDKKGNIISDIKLNDLKPYGKDVLEKIDKAPGITLYRLQKLNKTTPEVTNDCVDYWGKDNREVSVLYHNDTCTLLGKGYDTDSGKVIFKPMPHSRINMMKGEMAIRKDRLRKEKDILQAISPWIVGAMVILGCISIAYIMISGFIEISDNLAQAVTNVGGKPAPSAPKENLGPQTTQPEGVVMIPAS